MTDCETDDEQAKSGVPSKKHANFARSLDVDPGHLLTVGHSLKCVKPSAKVYAKIHMYIVNGHCPTHKMQLRILHIYKLHARNQSKDYDSFGTRLLLWHGTQRNNVSNILLNGFSKPEDKGQMYGRGIYFADRATKSAQYTGSTSAGARGVLLLCNVYLGRVFEAHHAMVKSVSAPPGYDTVKGLGQYVPEGQANISHRGMIIPLGKTTKPVQLEKLSLFYNEYIVYDPKNINVEYVVEFEFQSTRSGLGPQIQDKCAPCSICGTLIPASSLNNNLGDKPGCQSCKFRKGGSICIRCKLPAPSGGIIFKDFFFHSNCFLCHGCNSPMGSQSVYTREDDKNYCKHCYYRQFVPKCTKCGKFIEERHTIYESKPFHKECFCCARCQKSLADNKYWAKKGKTYCENCYCIQFGGTCFNCKQIIMVTRDPGINFGEKLWHTECFRCTGPCRNSLKCIKSHLPNPGRVDNPYCRDCYLKQFGKRCTDCRACIEGRYITTDGKEFHPACLKCSQCSQSIGAQSFFLRNGMRICNNCK